MKEILMHPDKGRKEHIFTKMAKNSRESFVKMILGIIWKESCTLRMMKNILKARFIQKPINLIMERFILRTNRNMKALLMRKAKNLKENIILEMDLTCVQRIRSFLTGRL